jgi:hypothetical protein
MRLTLQESGDIIHGRTELDDAAVRLLHDQSGGWAAGLTLLVERARRGEPIANGEGGGALQPVFAYFAEQLLAKDFGDDIDALQEIAFLGRATPTMAKTLTGRDSAGHVLARLHRRHLFTQRRMVGNEASYELHALLRAYLQQRAAGTWSGERRRDVMARAARLLEANGEREDAVRFYRELEDWPALSRVALAAAPALLAQGRRATLREWIDQVPESARLQAPRLIYWMGCARTMDAPREARTHFRNAHAALSATADGFGRVLAASAIVYTYYLELAELREMDPWIRELNDALEADGFAALRRSSCTCARRRCSACASATPIRDASRAAPHACSCCSRMRRSRPTTGSPPRDSSSSIATTTPSSRTASGWCGSFRLSCRRRPPAPRRCGGSRSGSCA